MCAARRRRRCSLRRRNRLNRNRARMCAPVPRPRRRRGGRDDPSSPPTLAGVTVAGGSCPHRAPELSRCSRRGRQSRAHRQLVPRRGSHSRWLRRSLYGSLSRFGGNATRTSGAGLALSNQGFKVSRGGGRAAHCRPSALQIQVRRCLLRNRLEGCTTTRGPQRGSLYC